MRITRRERQNTLRRQEQEYRDKISKPRLVKPSENSNNDRNTLSVPSFDPRLLPAVITVREPQPQKQTTIPRRHIPLFIFAYALGIVGIGINGWFAYSRGTTEIDKLFMFSLGFFGEAIMFFLPSQIANHSRNRNIGGFIFGCVVYVFLFAFALTNSLGFASFNLQDTATARAERITPVVSDAQRRLDTLTASRVSECLKRGDKCRQLEKDEQQALETLREAREKVSATSDPQVVSASKLITWLSLGRYNPTAEDFTMLRLLLLTLLPQLGGMVLMVSQRS